MTTTVTDKLILIAKDLGLPPKTEDYLRQADHAVAEAVGDAAKMAGDYTRTNRDKIAGALDKAEQAVAEKTDSKYADTVSKVRSVADKGIAKFAALGSHEAAAEAGVGTSDPADAPAAAAATPDTATPTADGTHAVPPRPVWAEATDASDWTGEPDSKV